jgi:spermidine/putrescine transport system ATP-binding protein
MPRPLDTRAAPMEPPDQGVRPEARPTAVELRAVVKQYGDVSAVRDVTLAVRAGEFFSLLGPSGCGKTTTLSLIAGFAEPDAGEILIQGRSMAGIPPHRRPVNTVFQSYALFPHMTVAENIAFGLRMKRTPAAEIRQRVARMLALTSLEGLGGRRPAQLSGGQQQRVALARALVNQPAVLLLDEPLGSLDLKLRRQMQLELARIQREVGITFIYVTHDQEEAMTMSDRLAVMDGGQVVQVGSPRAVYETPATRFVADFIGSSNILAGRVVGLDAGGVVIQLDGGERLRAPRAAGLAAGAAASVVVRADRVTVADGAVPEGRNTVTGQVVKVSYLGAQLQIVLRTAAGVDVTVHRPSPAAGDATRLPEVGASVRATWAVADSLAFAEPAGGDARGPADH